MRKINMADVYAPDVERMMFNYRLVSDYREKVKGALTKMEDEFTYEWFVRVEVSYGDLDVRASTATKDDTDKELVRKDEFMLMTTLALVFGIRGFRFERRLDEYEGKFSWRLYRDNFLKKEDLRYGSLMPAVDMDLDIQITNMSHNCKLEKYEDTITKYKAICKDDGEVEGEFIGESNGQDDSRVLPDQTVGSQ